MQARRGPFKELSRAVRLAFYHWRNGPDFDYHGIKIHIPDDIPFSIRKQLMQGRYEEPERRLIERFLDPAQPLIELGGSLGVLSAYTGRRLLPETPYLVVEANTRVVEACRRNARTGRGPAGRVTVMNCALAYGVKEVSFPVSDHVHVNRLDAILQKQLETMTVPAHTLAELRGMLDDRPGPFTLVMDIEGAEYDVFTNDRAALGQCTLAVVETHPHFFAERGKTLDDFLALARDNGFAVAAQDGNSFAFQRA